MKIRRTKEQKKKLKLTPKEKYKLISITSFSKHDNDIIRKNKGKASVDRSFVVCLRGNQDNIKMVGMATAYCHFIQ